jgi:DNA-binding MurR/RpiR family transcriptional regulator
MFNIDATKLNALERSVLDALTTYARDHEPPGIVDAAQVCGCSVSQVSKAIRKAGFDGYKPFISYLYYGEKPARQTLPELERLKLVLDEFDVSLVDEMAALLLSHEKIVLFGYGPSYICAQYFEYKLRFCTAGFIACPPDEESVGRMLDDKTLLVILTTTGQYRSFEALLHTAKEREADAVVITEEFNSSLMDNCDRYLVLSRHNQSESLRPYEKTRTVFFIFLEQVVQKILETRAGKEG